MSTPQTPRRSNRQQKLPARYGGGILFTSQIYQWPAHPAHTRPTQSADLLPGESSESRETQLYSSLIRCGPHSKPTLRTYGKRGSANPVASGSKASETFSVGDTVLVASVAKTTNVAVITALWRIVREDDEAEDDHDDDSSESMRIRVHWFVRPAQLGSNRQKRESLPNEIYYTLANSTILTPQEIIRKCYVTSRAPSSRFPTSPWPLTSKGTVEGEGIPEADRFICRSAVNPQRGLFYEFAWEAHRGHAIIAPPGDWSRWEVGVSNVVPETPKPKTRISKKRRADTESEREESDSSLASPSKRPRPTRKAPKRTRPLAKKPRTKTILEDEGFEPELSGPSSPSRSSAHPTDASDTESDTPRKPAGSDFELDNDIMKTPSKRKRNGMTSATTTPRHKRIRNLAMPTPHSKAALRARRKKATMVVKPPPPGMDEEHYKQLQKLPKDPWLRGMHALHVAARPNELPCREEEYGRVLRSVLELIEEGSGGCVYISGVPGTGKTATVHAVVRELKRMAENNEANPFTYVEINGLKIPSPHAAYNLLWETVSGHDVAADGHLTISWKEALKRLTKHFSGGASAGPGGHACVVLMDELDQLMTTKQDVVYNFFNWPTLMNSRLIVLAVANTMDLPERVMSGRVRSRLGMVRINFQPYLTAQLETIVNARLAKSREGLPAKAPEVISKDGVKFASMKVSSISGDARRVLDICRRTVELVQPTKKTAGMREVREVISAMQNSPTVGYLEELSLHERIMLAAVLKCVKKEGVEEVKWGDVQHQHIIYTSILTGDDDPTRKPTFAELNGVLDSLIASRAMLIEDGAAAQRKPVGERKVVLNLEQIEVERVLSEIGGQMWKNALGVS